MKRIFFTIFFSVVCSSLLWAQIQDSNTEAINQYFQVNLIQSESEKVASPKSGIQEMSYVEVIQTGTNNNININSLQSGDEQIVNQTGANNNYEYYNYYSKENSSLEINQDGALNSVQVFGENSLMKDATINQKSNFESIVIKNYSN